VVVVVVVVVVWCSAFPANRQNLKTSVCCCRVPVTFFHEMKGVSRRATERLELSSKESVAAQ
ncbi:hypothetical protein OFM52_29655, partial [Escherichia coli]|nr:hypothetical protein [Escherichia coli]